MKKNKIKIFGAIGAVFLLASVGTLVPIVRGEETELADEEKTTFEQQIATLSEKERAKITEAMGKYTEKNADGMLKVTIDY